MSPAVMYKMKPVFNLSNEFEHTNSMYKLKNLNPNPYYDDESQLLITPTHGSGNEGDVLGRQERLLCDLQSLKKNLHSIRDKIKQKTISIDSTAKVDRAKSFQDLGIQDFVINADPQYPPYSLLWLPKLWQTPFNIGVHVHSSVTTSSMKLNVFKQLQCQSSDPSYINLTFVWKNVGSDPQLVLSPVNCKTTLGEVNILRFFDSLFLPEEEASVKFTKDELLDLAHRLNHASGKEVHVIVTKLSNLLGKDGSFIRNSKLTNADVGIWSALCKKVKLNALPSNLRNWVVSFNSQLDINLFEDR